MIHDKLLYELGVNYLFYSHIAAKVLRRCLKKQFIADALARENSYIQIFKVQGNKKREMIEPFKFGSARMKYDDAQEVQESHG